MKKYKKFTSVALIVCLIVFSSVACESETTASFTNAAATVSTVSESTSAEETKATVEETSTVASTEASTTKASSTKSSSTKSSSTKSSSAKSSSAASVTVPAEAETGSNLVWVPTKGGKKYHSNSSCSGMKDPMQVSKDTAVTDGYTPCSKCYK